MAKHDQRPACHSVFVSSLTRSVCLECTCEEGAYLSASLRQDFPYLALILKKEVNQSRLY
jgi:hypothetical protein